MLASTPLLADTQTVAPETAVVVVIVALLVGWYGRMWREREGDRSVTRTRAANARKAVWHARWVIVVIGIAVLAIIDVLLHGGGR
jgi:protein-S-isoprenylcysteine O-methyltransferase Ste14